MPLQIPDSAYLQEDHEMSSIHSHESTSDVYRRYERESTSDRLLSQKHESSINRNNTVNCAFPRPNPPSGITTA